ncbi:hypothetical protein E3O65_00300 [Cryobacterium breve]|uniref:Holin n=2 Tax=Microbacteriaceae TaxID=85023 RepID=A0ABY2JAL3_9MICO|nr:hypothetical protein E3T20_08380 [Cryobacterium sp. TmT3-12]TFD01996.1 hypothetical protein E3O65_00300 [Cryobacterium breve]
MGELAAAATFATVAAAVAVPRLEDRQDSAALWVALVPLLVVLVQAGAYWLLACTWVQKAPMPRGLVGAYRVFRIADSFLLFAGLVGVIVWWPDHLGLALATLGVWVFGAIEYVNYFVVRLSYPVRRWTRMVGQWRIPQIIKDLNSTTQ